MRATDKQKRAGKRNWNKALVANMHHTAVRMGGEKDITFRERMRLLDLADFTEDLLNDWDGESEELGFKVKPKKIEEIGDEYR